MNNENEVIGWGDSFQAEESSFKLLPAGEYNFTVTGFERKIYDGNSNKIQNGTPYAEVTLKVSGAEGESEVSDRIFMLKKWQWKLTQFFAGIGQSPIIGQPFQPNWSNVVGSQGRVKLIVNKYTKRDGSEGESNQVDEYLPGGQTQPVYTQQPTYNQAPQQPNFNQPPMQNQPQQGFTQPQQGFNQPQQPQAGGFQPGAF